MLVKDYMTRHPIMIQPELPAAEAHSLGDPESSSLSPPKLESPCCIILNWPLESPLDAVASLRQISRTFLCCSMRSPNCPLMKAATSARPTDTFWSTRKPSKSRLN